MLLVVVLVVALCVAAYVAWILFGSKDSNPYGYASIGGIPSPSGYRRIQGDAYSNYLRSLPLKKKGLRLQLYTGGDSHLQSLCYAVVDMPLLSNDEQCADVCMRLRAEYLFGAGLHDRIRFQDVNGRMLAYDGDGSRKSLESYLRKLYGVASTYSLCREMTTRPLKDMQPGDVFVFPAGRYGLKMGHAVMVADVAVNEKGKKAFLLVEGNTPARSIHVMRNFLDPMRSPWFVLDEKASSLLLSGFPYRASDLRHF